MKRDAASHHTAASAAVASVREAGPEFLSALTAFVNQVLGGGCPSVIAPVFWWAPLGAE